jgi:2-furoyl-CoA dehydrogenase FAD binding subunit
LSKLPQATYRVDRPNFSCTSATERAQSTDLFLSLVFRPKCYLKPETQAELEKYLKEYGARGKIIAGGTGLYEIAHRGLLSEIEALIDIGRIGLSYVREEKGYLSIGSATTMSALAKSRFILRREYGAIGDALRAIQPLQVKNVATVGGAICTALPFLDLPVALEALGAKVEISPSRARENLSDFIKGYFSVELSESEFLKEVQIPKEIQGAEYSSAFQKFALTHDDWAIMNCSAALVLDDSRIKASRIFFGGGLSERPTRAQNIESDLEGINATDEPKIKDIFEKNLETDIEPVSDIRASSEYRMHIAKVLGRRTVSQAAERLSKGAKEN